MKRICVLAMVISIFCVGRAWADTVVLRDAASYSGQVMGANVGQVGFTDNQGIQYKFPAATCSHWYLRTRRTSLP